MIPWKQRAAIFWTERCRFQLRAFWDIVWEARRAFSQDGCMNLSAALAFYTILSTIPFLFLLVSAAGTILGSSEQAYAMATSFFDRLFPQASSIVFREVKAISERAGVLGWVGLLSMVWTASIIFSSLEFAMGVVFRVERRRKFLQSKLLALSMIPAAALVFFLSLLVSAVSGLMTALKISLLGVVPAESGIVHFLLSYLFPYLTLALAFTAIYKVIPNTVIAWRHALTGGASCAFLFEIAKHFFAWYIGRSHQYSVVYGSLEAIVLLVLWAFYSASILLFCAEVVSAYRRREVTLLEKAFL